MFKNWDWGDTWLSLLYAAVATVLIGLSMWICSDKYTIAYSLGEKDHKPVIIREIDNYVDDLIEVDRNISLDSMVTIIEKLNNTLKTK